MKICISGWYFRADFLKAIAGSGYEAFVVKHREGDTQGIPSALHENRGLEFGAYRQYVENHWNGESDVLFCHDDAEIADLAALKDIELLAGMGVEHCYIFRDEYDEMVNGGAHGRGMWMRGDIIKKLAEDFPADMDNEGVNIGKVAQKGILMFHRRIMQCGSNTGVITILPQIQFGHRGRIHDRMFVYRKTHGPVPGGIVNVA